MVNNNLVQAVRESLAEVPHVEEKRMFGGVSFMVNGKMCVNVGPGRIMCRIAPDRHETLIQERGCRTVMMKGREYKGWVHVDADAVKTKAALTRWIRLALDFNEQAKAWGAGKRSL